jgi:hypothetical protein
MNLLHFALYDCHEDMAILNTKVRYISDLCPDLLLLHDNSGYTPLHQYLHPCEELNLEAVTIIYEADKTIVIQEFLNMDEGNEDEDGHFVETDLFLFHCISC